MPFNVKEENAALGLKYTASALSHANLRACTHFITRPFESSSGGPVRYISAVALFDQRSRRNRVERTTRLRSS